MRLSHSHDLLAGVGILLANHGLHGCLRPCCQGCDVVLGCVAGSVTTKARTGRDPQFGVEHSARRATVAKLTELLQSAGIAETRLQARGWLAEVDAVGNVQEIRQGVVAHLQPVQRCLSRSIVEPFEITRHNALLCHTVIWKGKQNLHSSYKQCCILLCNGAESWSDRLASEVTNWDLCTEVAQSVL